MKETIKTKKKIIKYFVGVDVSKNELDYAVMKGKEFVFHKEGKNDTKDIIWFIEELKRLPGFKPCSTIFCMEATGFYCNHLLLALTKLKTNIVVENALHIKNSLGLIRGKDDRRDAIRIAQFAQKNCDDLTFWEPRRPIINKLAGLVTLRNRLIGILVRLKTPMNEQENFVKKDLQNQGLKFCKISMEAIQTDLTEINIEIEKILISDDRLKRLTKLITSVKGVGIVVATQIIISTNEFLDIKNPKKFACYAGVAPFKRESGLSSQKPKVSHIANKKVKSLLHMSAITAIRCDDEIKAYYERKTLVEGKSKMSVFNAIRNKIILRIFACVNQDRCYEKKYIRPGKMTLVAGQEDGFEPNMIKKEINKNQPCALLANP